MLERRTPELRYKPRVAGRVPSNFKFGQLTPGVWSFSSVRAVVAGSTSPGRRYDQGKGIGGESHRRLGSLLRLPRWINGLRIHDVDIVQKCEFRAGLSQGALHFANLRPDDDCGNAEIRGLVVSVCIGPIFA
jgi:hypothetical protein